MNQKDLLITTKGGFIDKFYEELPKHTTQTAAYEAVEKEHRKIFGKSKYSNYDSFRKVRDFKKN